jgi:hypothetical protein
MPVNTRFPPLTVENYKLLPETGPRYQFGNGGLRMAESSEGGLRDFRAVGSKGKNAIRVSNSAIRHSPFPQGFSCC